MLRACTRAVCDRPDRALSVVVWLRGCVAAWSLLCQAWSPFFLATRASLCSAGGLFNLSNSALLRAVQLRYFKKEDDRTRCHTELLAFFERAPAELCSTARRVAELPYQMLHACQIDRLERFLLNMTNFQVRAQAPTKGGGVNAPTSAPRHTHTLLRHATHTHFCATPHSYSLPPPPEHSLLPLPLPLRGGGGSPQRRTADITLEHRLEHGLPITEEELDSLSMAELWA